MKKKLIIILSICAALIISLCNIDLKSISAAEEQEEIGEDVTVTLGDNLFTSISYGYSVDSTTGKTHLNGSDSLLLTNLIEIQKDKDLLVSIKFQLSNSVDTEKNISLSDSSFVLFDENFKNVTTTKEFYHYNIVDYYEADSSGSYYTATMLLKNPKDIVSGACYLTINPCFWYYSITGDLKYEYSSSITNMYVSFIEEGVIGYYNQLEALEIDYTPTSNNITWSNEAVNIDSNYIRVNSSSEMQINNFVDVTTATNSSGEELTISYGSMYTEEIHLEGEQYGYILKASDNNKSEFMVVYLNVIDQTPPVISGATEYSVPNNSKLSIDAIKNSLIINDNSDSSNEVSLSLKYDYYSENYSKPGTYYVCFVATDTSGNSSDFVVEIKVEDRNKPQFYNEYGIVVTNMTVRKSPDSVLVMSDILSQLKAIDAVDGELTIKTHNDKYSGNGDAEGTYLVVLKAIDSSGNVAYFNVNIVVSSEMPKKTIFLNEKLIIVDKTKKLTESEFHTLIKLIGMYNPNTTSYTTINDDIYALSYNKTGEYLVEYNIITTSGVENDGVFSVRVVESRTAGTLKDEAEAPEETEKDGFIVTVLKWIWNLIVSLFEWIGSLFK